VALPPVPSENLISRHFKLKNSLIEIQFFSLRNLHFEPSWQIPFECISFCWSSWWCYSFVVADVVQHNFYNTTPTTLSRIVKRIYTKTANKKCKK